MKYRRAFNVQSVRETVAVVAWHELENYRGNEGASRSAGFVACIIYARCLFDVVALDELTAALSHIE